MPNRAHKNLGQIRRSACISLPPYTSPESFRPSDDDTSIFWDTSDDLESHFFPDNMFKWLDIDMPRRIDEYILLILDSIIDTFECFLNVFDTSSSSNISYRYCLQCTDDRTQSWSMEICLSHEWREDFLPCHLRYHNHGVDKSWMIRKYDDRTIGIEYFKIFESKFVSK